MKSPNKRHRKDQNKYPRKNIQQRDQAVEGGLVDANPVNAFVPDIWNGRALEKGLEENGDSQGQHKSSDEVGADSESGDAEDAHVE